MNHPKSILLACALALCATQAFAGPLAVDTTALPGWHSTASYSNTHGLVGTIDYAVWAPGTFPVGNFGPYVPTPGDFVYTYQAFETGTADLSQVGITLTGPADLLNIGDFVGNNGFGVVAGDPSISAFINAFDSANWLFDGVVSGHSTDGLAFSSPNGPIWATARNVDDGTIAFAIPIPSPMPNNVPEPATLTLASCGLAVLVFHCLRRRRGRASSL